MVNNVIDFPGKRQISFCVRCVFEAFSSEQLLDEELFGVRASEYSLIIVGRSLY